MIYYKNELPDEDRIKMCNCAKCKQELLGACMWGERIPPRYKKEYVFGTLAKRPYCWECFSKHRKNFASHEINIYQIDVNRHTRKDTKHGKR